MCVYVYVRAHTHTHTYIFYWMAKDKVMIEHEDEHRPGWNKAFVSENKGSSDLNYDKELRKRKWACRRHSFDQLPTCPALIYIMYEQEFCISNRIINQKINYESEEVYM